jgi:hypothetical protein
LGTQKPVEQCALAHIRSTDDDHGRKRVCHPLIVQAL